MAAAPDIDCAEKAQRLFELLAPSYDEARALARRIAGNNADGDDLFQDATLRAIAKLSQLREPSRFRLWFYRILLSVQRNHYRRGFWRRLISRDADAAAGAVPDLVGDDGSRWAERRASAARAQRALATLPPVQREAVVLFEIQGFTVEEVAELQCAKVSAVKSRLARGRARLRSYYERHGICGARAAGAASTTSVADTLSPCPSAPEGAPR